MKNQLVTTGIVLSRTDFQEADRILTILTPDQGKVSVMAKGVRKARSKLAGGIELFSVSDLTLLPTRGELQTLISSRLDVHYGNIVKDIHRTMLGYEFLKRINRVTEDAAGEEYFNLLRGSLNALNDLDLAIELVDLWFGVQLLRITGHIPNLRTDSEGNKLESDESYLFDYDEMAFRQQTDGPYKARHIKLLRLAYSAEDPGILKQVIDAVACAPDVQKLITALVQHSLRV